MKNLLVLCLLVTSIQSFGQSIFIDIEDNIYTYLDSLTFKGKKIQKYQGILKIPLRRNIKFYYYKNGKKYKVKIKSNSIYRFNTLSIKSAQEIWGEDTPIDKDKSLIYIDRGHYKRIVRYKDGYCCSRLLHIKVNGNLINRDGLFETGSDKFDRAITENPEFFFTD